MTIVTDISCTLSNSTSQVRSLTQRHLTELYVAENFVNLFSLNLGKHDTALKH